ncbi:Serine/threonine-protein kinase MRCK beta, partial [Cichlidogyrus casuarinus]
MQQDDSFSLAGADPSATQHKPDPKFSNGTHSSGSSGAVSLSTHSSPPHNLPHGQVADPAHKFVLTTTREPTKCAVCSSLLLGQRNQGITCQDCSFVCHQRCQSLADRIPCSAANSRVPKSRGIKHGWTKQFAVLSDMKLFFYEVQSKEVHPNGHANGSMINGGISVGDVSAANFNPQRFSQYGTLNSMQSQFSLLMASSSLGGSSSGGSVPNAATTIGASMGLRLHSQPVRIVDLASPGFAVYRVTDSEVIHAKASSVPCILKVITDKYTTCAPLFVLFESNALREKWFQILDDLTKILSRGQELNSDEGCLVVKEVYDSKLALLKQAKCACVLDENRILLGLEDGLHVIDIKHNVISRVGEKKPVYQIDALTEDLQLVIVLQDKQRHLKLVLLGAIEGMNCDPIRIAEPKSCSLFCSGYSGTDCSTYLLCAADKINKLVYVYDIARIPNRHRKVREIKVPEIATALSLVQDGQLVCVGCTNFFALYSLCTEASPQILLQTDLIDLDPSLSHIRQTPHQAIMGIELDQDEFLLVFDTCGVYVNSARKKTRTEELVWGATPLQSGFAYRAPYMYVSTEAGLLVYNVFTGIWVATLSSRRVLPLVKDAHLCLVQQAQTPGPHCDPSPQQGATSPTSTNGGLRLIYLPITPRHHIPMDSACMRRSMLMTKSSTPTCAQSPSTSTVELCWIRRLHLPSRTTDGSLVSSRMRKSRRFSWRSGEQETNVMNESGPGDNDQHTKPPTPSARSESVGSKLHTSSRNLARALFSSSSNSSANAQQPQASKLISGPSNFRHISHMGPDQTGPMIDLSSGSNTPLTDIDRNARARSVLDDKLLSPTRSNRFNNSSEHLISPSLSYQHRQSVSGPCSGVPAQHISTPSFTPRHLRTPSFAVSCEYQRLSGLPVYEQRSRKEFDELERSHAQSPRRFSSGHILGQRSSVDMTSSRHSFGEPLAPLYDHYNHKHSTSDTTPMRPMPSLNARNIESPLPNSANSSSAETKLSRPSNIQGTDPWDSHDRENADQILDSPSSLQEQVMAAFYQA